MARPDLYMSGQAEELAARGEEIACTAAGEIAACRADVWVEDGIATEYILCGRLSAQQEPIAGRVHEEILTSDPVS